MLYSRTAPEPYVPLGGGTIVADNTNKNLVVALVAAGANAGRISVANYMLLRVDPLAAATDGIFFTEVGDDPTVSTSNRFPLGAGEEVELNPWQHAFQQIQVTRLGANSVNVYVLLRQYPTWADTGTDDQGK